MRSPCWVGLDSGERMPASFGYTSALPAQAGPRKGQANRAAPQPNTPYFVEIVKILLDAKRRGKTNLSPNFSSLGVCVFAQRSRKGEREGIRRE